VLSDDKSFLTELIAMEMIKEFLVTFVLPLGC